MAKLSTQRPAALKIVGHSVTRVDAHAKVTGSAEFSGDRVDAKQLLYGKTLRSPYAHAEILRIDTAKAEALPGVHAVITYHDAPDIPFEAGADLPGEQSLAPVHLLNRIMRHAGDEAAAVAAESEAIAEEALRLIHIDYRPLPFVLNELDALAGDAPTVRGGSNLAGAEAIEFSRGDIALGMKQAELVVERVYRTQSTSPVALEPRYAVASWDGDRLTVWKASRNVHGDRDKLARIFQLPHDHVRVIAAYLGGGFGSKDETRLGRAEAAVRARNRTVGVGDFADEARVGAAIKVSEAVAQARCHAISGSVRSGV